MDSDSVSAELMSFDTDEPVRHYEMGRYDAQRQGPEHVHDGVVLKWFIGAPAGSIEGWGLVRWDEDGTYHVANVSDLLHRPR